MKLVNRRSLTAALALVVLLSTSLTFVGTAQQGIATPALHARSYTRLFIRSATVIYGSAKPAYGPLDVVIEWTIKDGIPYHVPTLMREVRDMVTAARQRVRSTAP